MFLSPPSPVVTFTLYHDAGTAFVWTLFIILSQAILRCFVSFRSFRFVYAFVSSRTLPKHLLFNRLLRFRSNRTSAGDLLRSL